MGPAIAVLVFSETSTGPGMKSLMVLSIERSDIIIICETVHQITPATKSAPNEGVRGDLSLPPNVRHVCWPVFRKLPLPNSRSAGLQGFAPRQIPPENTRADRSCYLRPRGRRSNLLALHPYFPAFPGIFLFDKARAVSTRTLSRHLKPGCRMFLRLPHRVLN